MTNIDPRKLRVIADERAWANVRTQKMGWLRPGDVIEIFELYQGWTQFRPIEGCDDLLPLNDDYNQYWIDPASEASFEDYVDEPEPPEPPPAGGISTTAAGEALQTLIRFFMQEIKR